MSPSSPVILILQFVFFKVEFDFELRKNALGVLLYCVCTSRQRAGLRVGGKERERIGEGRDGPGSVNREQAKGVRSENEPRAPSMRRAHTEIIALDGLAHARPRHESRRPFYAPSSHWRTSPIACAPSPARTCGQINTFSNN